MHVFIRVLLRNDTTLCGVIFYIFKKCGVITLQSSIASSSLKAIEMCLNLRHMRHIVLSEAQSEAQSVAHNHVTFLAILSGGGVEHS